MRNKQEGGDIKGPLYTPVFRLTTRKLGQREGCGWMLLEEGIIYSRMLFFYFLPKPFFPKERENMPGRKYQFKC